MALPVKLLRVTDATSWLGPVASEIVILTSGSLAGTPSIVFALMLILTWSAMAFSVRL
jgi:hypothetical protein